MLRKRWLSGFTKRISLKDRLQQSQKPLKNDILPKAQPEAVSIPKTGPSKFLQRNAQLDLSDLVNSSKNKQKFNDSQSWKSEGQKSSRNNKNGSISSKPSKKITEKDESLLEPSTSEPAVETEQSDPFDFIVSEEDDDGATTSSSSSKRNPKKIAKEREREKRELLRSVKEERQRELEKKGQKSKTKTKQKTIHLHEGITVANLSAAIGVSLDSLQWKMKQVGFEAYPADYFLNSEIASMIVLEYNMNPVVTEQDSTDLSPRPEPDDWSIYPLRPPVITIMGHVDHGKTTLLDSLRKTSVAAGEAGGITQHIGAFSVELPSKKKITFLDTPGHAAFSQMRERGAQVTDIVVLVVAADDGVMPQTIGAIQHSLKANVPIVVAVNKCDKPGVDPKKIKESLLRYEVVVEEMGGDVPAVHISGKTGMGLNELEETILAMSEVADYRGDPEGPVEGVVVESKLSKQFGNVATIIVKRGTLSPGAILVAGSTWCRVKRMLGEYGRPVHFAGPSQPVEVLGWKELPEAGDGILQSETEGLAKRVILNRKRRQDLKASIESIDEINEKRQAGKSEMAQAKEKAKLENKRISRVQKEVKTIEDDSVYRVLVKGNLESLRVGDVHGSVEAIEGVIGGLPCHEVSCNIVSSGVGGVTESDLEFAQATKADILAFNVPVLRSIQNTADQMKVNISSHSVIYTLIDHIKAEMSNLLEPEIVTNVVGEATILALFQITVKKKIETIAGCKILSGKVTRQNAIRVIRNGEIIHEGNIKTFKHHKKDILEASKGLECGIAIDSFGDIQVGDNIQSINYIEKKRFIE